MYGLLGKKLGHSFSKPIHESFTNKSYQLIEVEDLSTFFSERHLIQGLNVTIPYKKKVIPFLDELSTEAKNIGVVNTIKNERGKLIGFNTDYYGLEKSLSYHDIQVNGRDVIILGNGSTSRTIQYYCEQNLANSVTIFARNPKNDEHHFSDVENFKNTEIVFNATPVGMFPNNNDDILININCLPNLISVIDVIYNPLRSKLLVAANKRGLKTVNGLMMLIQQAIKAIEIFHEIKIPEKEVQKYYLNLLKKTSNFVLVGMPMSGKTYYTQLLSDLYRKDFVDLDREIEIYEDRSIPSIFKSFGETYFRTIESQVAENFSKLNNQAISCGGGIILNEKNIDNLKQNGIIIYLDAPLSLLEKCNPKGRPLLKNKQNLRTLYNERYPLYQKYADITITKDSFDEKTILNEIEVKINEYFGT